MCQQSIWALFEATSGVTSIVNIVMQSFSKPEAMSVHSPHLGLKNPGSCTAMHVPLSLFLWRPPCDTVMHMGGEKEEDNMEKNLCLVG